ncbi:MAG: diaminopimelate epimerase [Bryobacteraceae bacterium]|nr:diaminopimelate epimerase [Bryobacteraceae bacterium]
MKFIKAHGAGNDFLLTWTRDVPPGVDPAEIAKAICHRNLGIGADGWMQVDAWGDLPAIELWNSDGSRSEISGNGTRCAAALLIAAGHAGDEIRIRTGAGLKHLSLMERDSNSFLLLMNMGRPVIEEPRLLLPLADGDREVTTLNAGNPQCALFVNEFALDWRKLGREIEWHPRFPARTNVSFVRVSDDHTIDVRFWERGAGETQSSGTGSTGAVAAAIARGLVKSPVTVRTPAGPLFIEWEEGGDLFLTGPARIIAEGEFYG